MNFSEKVVAEDAINYVTSRLEQTKQSNCIASNQKLSSVQKNDEDFQSDYFTFDDLTQFNIISLLEKKIMKKLETIKLLRN